MNQFKALSKTPQFLIAQIFLEAVIACALLGLAWWVYTQGQTEHQICQVFQLVGDRTQQQINLNKLHFASDMKKHDKAAVVLDRKAISDATSFLIRIRRVQC